MEMSHFRKSRDSSLVEYKAFEKHDEVAKKEINIARVYEKKEDWQSALNHYHSALQQVSHNFSETGNREFPKPNQIFAKLTALDILKGKAKCLYHLSNKNNDHELLKLSFESYQLAVQLI